MNLHVGERVEFLGLPGTIEGAERNECDKQTWILVSFDGECQPVRHRIWHSSLKKIPQNFEVGKTYKLKGEGRHWVYEVKAQEGNQFLCWLRSNVDHVSPKMLHSADAPNFEEVQ